MIQRIQTNVLVIGGGGAAARAALEAYNSGVDTFMIVKGHLGSSGATAYPVSELAGFSFADGCSDPDDSPEVHFEDIMKAGLGTVDAKLARIVAEEAPQAFHELQRWGVKFETTKGKHFVRRACFSSKPRTHYIKGHGIPIMRVLSALIEKTGIRVQSSTMATNLLIQDGICLGATAIDSRGNFLIVTAPSTILATGGAGRLFRLNLNPPDLTGDGYAMAYRAGAKLVNMEFLQMGFGTVNPMSELNRIVWLLHPQVYNEDKEQFLKKHLPSNLRVEECMDSRATHYPFSTRAISKYIDIAITKESPKTGPIYLDLTKVSEDTIASVPNSSVTYEWFASHGINLRKEPVEMAIYAHALNGGIRIDEWGSSSIQGLYAAGETAGGPHGADRLGGNMFVTCQVFGKRAGKRAAEEAKRRKRSTIGEKIYEIEVDRIREIEEKRGKIRPRELKRKIQDVMSQSAMVARTGEGLSEALHQIEKVNNDPWPQLLIESRSDVNEALEVQNLMEVGFMATKAALIRKESRGSHHREDFPDKDDKKWAKSISIKKGAFSLAS